MMFLFSCLISCNLLAICLCVNSSELRRCLTDIFSFSRQLRDFIQSVFIGPPQVYLTSGVRKHANRNSERQSATTVLSRVQLKANFIAGKPPFWLILLRKHTSCCRSADQQAVGKTVTVNRVKPRQLIGIHPTVFGLWPADDRMPPYQVRNSCMLCTNVTPHGHNKNEATLEAVRKCGLDSQRFKHLHFAIFDILTSDHQLQQPMSVFVKIRPIWVPVEHNVDGNSVTEPT
ncbi:hypothetical protein CSKR_107232 [Clonorchis sinensis]|uniref:Uncharacterized protein n=1 Tax=Clonorchis sinensis TaxID=79923 RepID=A0A3R7GPM4_CLOSI|nr:hypothetical protein CSKR_107232 [Clonorchis sinensis]